MYGFSRACAGRTQDIAALATTQFPRDKAEQIIRHMNAAMIAGYVGMGGPYSKRKFFEHYNKAYNLMTAEEMELISHLDMDSAADVMKELITWCNHDVAEMKNARIIDTIEATEMHDRILQFRASMDGMYDYCDQVRDISHNIAMYAYMQYLFSPFKMISCSATAFLLRSLHLPNLSYVLTSLCP